MGLNNQICKNNISKKSHYQVERAKNSIRALAFNLIDFDNNQVYKDKKKLEIIKNLRKELVILKPDKGNGLVLVRTIITILSKTYFQIHQSLNKSIMIPPQHV